MKTSPLSLSLKYFPIRFFEFFVLSKTRSILSLYLSLCLWSSDWHVTLSKKSLYIYIWKIFFYRKILSFVTANVFERDNALFPLLWPWFRSPELCSSPSFGLRHIVCASIIECLRVLPLYIFSSLCYDAAASLYLVHDGKSLLYYAFVMIRWWVVVVWW